MFRDADAALLLLAVGLGFKVLEFAAASARPRLHYCPLPRGLLTLCPGAY